MLALHARPPRPPSHLRDAYNRLARTVFNVADLLIDLLNPGLNPSLASLPPYLPPSGVALLQETYDRRDALRAEVLHSLLGRVKGAVGTSPPSPSLPGLLHLLVLLLRAWPLEYRRAVVEVRFFPPSLPSPSLFSFASFPLLFSFPSNTCPPPPFLPSSPSSPLPQGPDPLPTVLLQKALEGEEEVAVEGGKEGRMEGKSPWLTAAFLLWDLLAQPVALPPKTAGPGGKEEGKEGDMDIQEEEEGKEEGEGGKGGRCPLLSPSSLDTSLTLLLRLLRLAPPQPLLLQASLTLLARLLSSSELAARFRKEGGLALLLALPAAGVFPGHTALMLMILKLIIEEPAFLQVDRREGREKGRECG